MERVENLGTSKRNSTCIAYFRRSACCIHIHDIISMCLTLTLVLFLELLCTGVPQDGAGDTGREEPPLEPYRNNRTHYNPDIHNTFS